MASMTWADVEREFGLGREAQKKLRQRGRLPFRLIGSRDEGTHEVRYDRAKVAAALAARPRRGRPLARYAAGVRFGHVVVLSQNGADVNVRCDCGRDAVVSSGTLSRRILCGPSCGLTGKAPSHVRVSRILNRVKVSARSRSRPIEMTLTRTDIERLRALGVPCHYCGGKIPDDCGGLDRVDSTRGYVAANVVPCCATCNTAKGHLLAYDEFRAALAVRRERLGPSVPLW